MLYVLLYSIRAGMRLSRVKNGCVMQVAAKHVPASGRHSPFRALLSKEDFFVLRKSL